MQQLTQRRNHQEPPAYSPVFPQYFSEPASGASVTYSSQSFAHQSYDYTLGSNPNLPTQQPNSAPAPPPGAKVAPRQSQRNTLLPREAHLHIPTRPVSARARLGPAAVLESRKGLSRVIDATSAHDVQTFGEQLKRSDRQAIELCWEQEDQLPEFAVSYVQSNAASGRFKFDDEQWACFVAVVGHLAACGISKFRVWLDQCLWLRDASQGSWAHTGILPYIMWPVISLGIKKIGGERSLETYKRMWPFLEEISGLWGMGVIFAREMRSNTPQAGWRKWMSYVHRARLQPEQRMELLLLNIFHGAVDHLETGWQDDVGELKEMARANVLLQGSELYIGNDWKQRIGATNASLKRAPKAIDDLALPVRDRISRTNGVNCFVDGSRTVMCGSWDGVREWLSGDGDGLVMEDYERSGFWLRVKRVQVICEEGEFELLSLDNFGKALWLLVAMNGRTSNFSRGKVAWTKIMTGVECCQLAADENLNAWVVGQVLEKQLERRVKVLSFQRTENEIEWE